MNLLRVCQRKFCRKNLWAKMSVGELSVSECTEHIISQISPFISCVGKISDDEMSIYRWNIWIAFWAKLLLTKNHVVEISVAEISQSRMRWFDALIKDKLRVLVCSKSFIWIKSFITQNASDIHWNLKTSEATRTCSSKLVSDGKSYYRLI